MPETSSDAGSDTGSDTGGDQARHPVSALPSVKARLLAYLAIVVGGVCGGLIGYSYLKLTCGVHNDQAITAGKPASAIQNCSSQANVGGLVGAIIASVGLAIVAVVVLRAMGEWRTIKADKDRAVS